MVERKLYLNECSFKKMYMYIQSSILFRFDLSRVGVQLQ